MRLILTALMLLGPPTPTPKEPDVLGDVVVEATQSPRGGPRLMKLAVASVDGEGAHAALVDEVLRRDLDLSGQFAMLDAGDDRARRAAEAIVRVAVGGSSAGPVELTARVFFDADADVPAHELIIGSAVGDLRLSTHRLVDDLMAVLTGFRGPFVRRLTFVATRGATRSVYVIDPDGYWPRRITDEHQLAAASAFGPDDRLYYAASVGNGRYKVYRHGDDRPLSLDPPGSVYGLDFSPDRTRVAVTIAVGADVRLFSGRSDFSDLRRVGDLTLALSPAIAAGGQIAVAGSRTLRSRIWLEGRPVTPRVVPASAPDFCEHPDGARLVYAQGRRRNSYIMAADARGKHAKRISRGRGRHSHPTCSPDGRLVAFFSTRTAGDGPGLYVMRVDGYHLRKIASVRGDSLSWSRVAAPAAESPTSAGK